MFGEEPLLQLGLGAEMDIRPETHVAAGAVELRTLSNGTILGRTCAENWPILFEANFAEK
jgi:hypothetical protein